MFVGIDLCGGRGRDPPAAPLCPGGEGARRGRWALGRGRPGVTRGRSSPSRQALAAVPFR